MKRAILSVIFFSGIFSQDQIVIPFDWSGQNGILIHEGVLFSNQAWTSGILTFDGTYSAFPLRYGGHTAKKVQMSEIGILPSFSVLPDSNLTTSFFDYYRGDYGLDKLDIGVEYQSKNQIIKISGFKRASFGNFAHYIHPVRNQGPLHHSYRIDYSTKNSKQKIEVSASRYITSSGLPDIVQNGYENDNIINGALRYQRQFERWTVDTHLSQFSQNRLLIHSLYSDSSLRFINRNSIDFQLRNNTGIEIGISQQFQQYSSKAKLRSVGWSSLYFRKFYNDFSIMAGVQFSEYELYQPYVFSFNYKKNTRIGDISFQTTCQSSPAHPDRNILNDNEFETRMRSAFNYYIRGRKVALKSYVNMLSLSAGDFYDYNVSLAGTRLIFSFNRNWQVYSQIHSPLNSSVNNLGTKIDNGIQGKFQLFHNNMMINFHLWSTSYSSSKDNFTFDPFLQFAHENPDKNYNISNHNLIHLEIESNVSGVLLHYKIYNLLNALGVRNETVSFKPNAIFPEIGRMMQFGVTWYFDN